MIQELFLLIRFQMADVIRARWIFIYGAFFFVFTSALLMFGGDYSKASASVLSIVLLIVPMISVLYSSIYWYNSESFNNLLLTQPLRRSSVFLAQWLSVSFGLAGSFVISTGGALLVNRSFEPNSIAILFFGCILSLIFVALGLLVAVFFTDRMKGVGAAFLLWLYFSVLHDILVFTVISLLKDYPIEIPAMLLTAANPTDLARIHVLLTLNLPAMMGYTGKILQHIISGALGLVLTASALLLWGALPVWVAVSVFRRRDL